MMYNLFVGSISQSCLLDKIKERLDDKFLLYYNMRLEQDNSYPAENFRQRIIVYDKLTKEEIIRLSFIEEPEEMAKIFLLHIESLLNDENKICRMFGILHRDLTLDLLILRSLRETNVELLKLIKLRFNLMKEGKK